MKKSLRLHYVSYSKQFIMTAQFKHYQLPDGLSEVVWPYHYQLCFVVRCGNSSVRLSKAALRPLAHRSRYPLFSWAMGSVTKSHLHFEHLLAWCGAENMGPICQFGALLIRKYCWSCKGFLSTFCTFWIYTWLSLILLKYLKHIFSFNLEK